MWMVYVERNVAIKVELGIYQQLDIAVIRICCVLHKVYVDGQGIACRLGACSRHCENGNLSQRMLMVP